VQTLLKCDRFPHAELPTLGRRACQECTHWWNGSIQIVLQHCLCGDQHISLVCTAPTLFQSGGPPPLRVLPLQTLTRYGLGFSHQSSRTIRSCSLAVAHFVLVTIGFCSANCPSTGAVSSSHQPGGSWPRRYHRPRVESDGTAGWSAPVVCLGRCKPPSLSGTIGRPISVVVAVAANGACVTGTSPDHVRRCGSLLVRGAW
jgi:hypothetical protein